jgi:hypothetical protein
MIILRWPSHVRVRGTEWMLASVMFGRGLTYLLPATTMSGRAGEALSGYWSQATWGWVSFLSGLTHLLALWINGTRRRTPHVRAACSGIGLAIWLKMCLLVFATGAPTGAWPMFLACTVWSGINIACAAQDARVSDEGHRESRGLIGGRC